MGLRMSMWKKLPIRSRSRTDEVLNGVSTRTHGDTSIIHTRTDGDMNGINARIDGGINGVRNNLLLRNMGTTV